MLSGIAGRKGSLIKPAHVDLTPGGQFNMSLNMSFGCILDILSILHAVHTAICSLRFALLYINCILFFLVRCQMHLIGFLPVLSMTIAFNLIVQCKHEVCHCPLVAHVESTGLVFPWGRFRQQFTAQAL